MPLHDVRLRLLRCGHELRTVARNLAAREGEEDAVRQLRRASDGTISRMKRDALEILVSAT